MDKWRDLVFSTLDRLGARERLLPGSLVMQQLAKADPDLGAGLRSHLRETKISFSKYLAQFPELHIKLRGAADMLVGFEGAVEGSVPEALPEFRGDVYDAFSTRADRPYVYDKASKRFKLDYTEGNGVIAVPPVSQEFLIEQRREFAMQQPRDIADRLVAAVAEERPLSAFRDCLNEFRLQQQWKRFRLLSVDQRLRKWAEDSKIPFTREWYNERPVSTTLSARTVIEILLAEMTDEEIRAMNVPLRAVEQMLRSMPIKR